MCNQRIPATTQEEQFAKTVVQTVIFKQFLDNDESFCRLSLEDPRDEDVGRSGINSPAGEPKENTDGHTFGVRGRPIVKS